ncbi:hypothetical protein K503DRAFT_192070 [Rhizopogon vinicolor AM-OR11-026]|uniref:Uncharacterized protein n=1 Tax=Rhizopogon vinicolor AM-OR11-026 TaxID=1314800 RepID=A0A1B7MDI8_9AGAM|nr:hypothetical protein K503DRAFT_192070 [Rhizopogon vinicolor AM-OR11-026]
MVMGFLKSELEALRKSELKALTNHDVLIGEVQKSRQNTSFTEVEAKQVIALDLPRCSSPTEMQDTGSHEHLSHDPETSDQTLSSDSVGRGVQSQAVTATAPPPQSSSRAIFVQPPSQEVSPSITTPLHSSSGTVGRGVQPEAGTTSMPPPRSSSRTSLIQPPSQEVSTSSSITLHSSATASSLVRS